MVVLCFWGGWVLGFGGLRLWLFMQVVFVVKIDVLWLCIWCGWVGLFFGVSFSVVVLW